MPSERSIDQCPHDDPRIWQALAYRFHRSRSLRAAQQGHRNAHVCFNSSHWQPAQTRIRRKAAAPKNCSNPPKTRRDRPKPALHVRNRARRCANSRKQADEGPGFLFVQTWLDCPRLRVSKDAREVMNDLPFVPADRHRTLPGCRRCSISIRLTHAPQEFASTNA
jgi:hypothetical protein